MEGIEFNGCPNCGEKKVVCACMRNKCIRCGKPVGNITFTYCDKCFFIDSTKGISAIEGAEKLTEGLIGKNK